MRIELLVLCLIVGEVLSASKNLEDQFRSYAAQFQKSYSSPLEYSRRLETFSRNLERINVFNDNAKTKGLSFRLGVNAFTEYDYKEFVALFTGYLGSQEKNASSARRLSPNFLRQTPPDTRDWRTEKCVNAVRNQGECGSCWAFATISVLETAYCRKNSKLLEFSEQQFVDCNYDATKGNYGCHGGLFPESFGYAHDQGVMLASDYPYIMRRSLCKYIPEKAVSKSGEYVQLGSEDELKTVIGNIGSVAVGVHVSKNFQNYKSGVLNDPECTDDAEANHAVVVIGYGTENDHDYWLIRNSWGPTWGESGYIKLARGKNMCKINTMPAYVVFP